MATILDLFKKKNSELYGITAKILINTRGSVDIPKKAALLTSSPNTLADLIGNQIGGALGGNANRPSDTIFKSDKIFAKPITLTAVTQAQLRRAADELDRPVFIKENPAPGSLIAKIKQTGASPAQVAAQIAVNAINNYGSKSGIKKLSAAIKGIGNEQVGYGTQYSRLDIGGKPLVKTSKFSNQYPVYQSTNRKEWIRSAVHDRSSDKPVAGISKFDLFNNDILETQYTDQTFKDALTNYNKTATPYVKFKLYGKDTNNLIILPGTISGI